MNTIQNPAVLPAANSKYTVNLIDNLNRMVAEVKAGNVQMEARLARKAMDLYTTYPLPSKLPSNLFDALIWVNVCLIGCDWDVKTQNSPEGWRVLSITK